MATSAVEDYLKCILLEEQRLPGLRVSMGHIGSSLGVTPGTVTSMMKALADGGLVSYEPYSGVLLTRAGEQLAAHVLRRHRLVELFLVQVLGMDWSEVHAEAERLEHAISDQVLERMDAMLGSPETDPHGDPIPDASGKVPALAVESLARALPGERLRVARVLDQSADFLRYVDQQGLKPGAEIQTVGRDEAADVLTLETGGETLRIGLRPAARILVERI
jgi:DtxR family Mn-dependent transcriptional regulator